MQGHSKCCLVLAVLMARILCSPRNHLLFTQIILCYSFYFICSFAIHHSHNIIVQLGVISIYLVDFFPLLSTSLMQLLLTSKPSCIPADCVWHISQC